MLKKKLANCRKSWTIKFNAIFGSVFYLLPILQTDFPQLRGYIPDDWFKWSMALIIVGNIVLRFKTSSDLADK